MATFLISVFVLTILGIIFTKACAGIHSSWYSQKIREDIAFIRVSWEEAKQRTAIRIASHFAAKGQYGLSPLFAVLDKDDTMISLNEMATKIETEKIRSGVRNKNIDARLSLAQLEVNKLPYYSSMQAPQIAASRASSNCLQFAMESPIRAAQLEKDNKRLETENASRNTEIKIERDSRDKIVETIINRMPAFGPNAQSVQSTMTREHCKQCNAERPFKGGKCTYCGSIN